MKVTFDQHIGVFKNAFNPEFCNEVISLYNNPIFKKSKRKEYFHDAPLEVDDECLDLLDFPLDYLNPLDEKTKKLIYNLKHHFYTILTKNIYPLYLQKYPGFPSMFAYNGFKIQKTKPGKGFHRWHTEISDWLDENHQNRYGVFTLYLNNVEEGGETEFLHQHIRCTPQQGTMVIFPAGHTHVHRGNTPLKGDKYIITGWLNLIPLPITTN